MKKRPRKTNEKTNQKEEAAMKKLILTLLLIVCLAAPAFAVEGAITFKYEESNKGGAHWIQVTATCTAGSSDNLYPDTLIGISVAGTFLMQVRTFYGSTGSTDDTDLYLKQNSVNTGYDVLNGAGVDKIDNAGDNDFQPTIGGSATLVPIYGPLWIDIDNNSVNSAVVTIVMDFIK